MKKINISVTDEIDNKFREIQLNNKIKTRDETFCLLIMSIDKEIKLIKNG